MSKQNGFTLIELMIVVAVVAIMASIALPSYTSYVLKTKRSDCKVALLAMSDLQERYYLTNNTYAPDTATLYGAAGQQLSPEGTCDMTVTNGDTNTFLLTATALGSQLADIENGTNCTVLTLDQAGVQGPPTAVTCW